MPLVKAWNCSGEAIPPIDTRTPILNGFVKRKVFIIKNIKKQNNASLTLIKYLQDMKNDNIRNTKTQGLTSYISIRLPLIQLQFFFYSLPASRIIQSELA